jgi:regulator of protease activity HflC (stomatin/prohibitin superfamily)
MDNQTNEIKNKKLKKTLPGLLMLFIFFALEAIVLFFFIISIKTPNRNLAIITLCICTIILSILLFGFKLLKPNSAYILTLFGNYIGTLEGPGFFYINPFAGKSIVGIKTKNKQNDNGTHSTVEVPQKTLSLKAITLNNQKQKINDLNGNPIEIGIVVIWKVVDGAKAVFNVENFNEFLSIQSDSALRTIVRNYPYDCPDEDNEKLSLRGDSIEIAVNLKTEIQNKVAYAGLEVIEAKITHLAYAQEIAAAMLQRQQASAIIDARKMIVDGAVGMVKMALVQLQEEGVLELDEERKAAMVSNLLVVLCGNKDVQPIVNTGTLY